jgi:hypothetical protein
MSFFNFLKTAIRVLTVLLQVLATMSAAYDASQADTARA